MSGGMGIFTHWSIKQRAHGLEQEQAGYGPWAESDPLPTFVNKVLSAHGLAHLFTTARGCFHATVAEVRVETETTWPAKPKI